MTNKYGIGLTIGVGSVGFAVISQDNNCDDRIEDFGVRFFDSGETANHKARKSHERRAYRNFRRLVRRRVHRKERVKVFLQKINLVSSERLKLWQEKHGNQNIFAVRLKGLSEKLTAEELADSIIHICNYRGYSDYYNEEISAKEAGLVKEGLAEFENIFSSGRYRSVADMILHDASFKTETDFPDYHNHKNSGRYFLIKREAVRKELLDILHVQQKYYQQLTDSNIDFLCDKIVFVQRDFEAGPGNENDKERKFMSFLDGVGKCQYYKKEKRAFKTTVIVDVYALVNCLSKYTYINEENSKVNLPREAAQAIIDHALLEASINERQLKAILKDFGIKLVRNTKIKVKLADTVATLKILKKCLEASGYDYQNLVEEEQFDLNAPSRLQRLCALLCENITPKRRARTLKANGWNDTLCKVLQHKQFGGTANVCERYMLDVIKAFLNGESVGKFKARLLQEKDALVKVNKQRFLPAITKSADEEIVKDIVLFKAINESRKVVNAIIRKYGSPVYINVEIGSDLRRFTHYFVHYFNNNLCFDSDKDRNVFVVKSVEVDDSQKPSVSYKQNKKFQGQLTDDNPIAKDKRKASSVVKVDAYGNETVLSASKYYCLEIYKDREKRTALRGIRYVDLVKKNKKLYLVAPYPENYLEHVMYLFQNDYIKICDARGNEKFAGFYRSIKAVTRNLINVRETHSDKDEYVYVTQKDVFKKYDVDVLGKLGGVVKGSVPFEVLPQKI